MVPCTWSTPADTAASVLATAHSVSLWTWMPSGLSGFTTFFTSARIAVISWGTQPPLVSQSTRQWAPAASAARRVASAYSRFRLKPSKKCSAS